MVAVGQTVRVCRVHVAASLGVSRLSVMDGAVSKYIHKYWPMVVIPHISNIVIAMVTLIVTFMGLQGDCREWDCHDDCNCDCNGKCHIFYNGDDHI